MLPLVPLFSGPVAQRLAPAVWPMLIKELLSLSSDVVYSGVGCVYVFEEGGHMLVSHGRDDYSYPVSRR